MSDAPKSFGRAWMRCWMIASLMFLGAELWSWQMHFTVRSAMQGAPRLMGATCGAVLFFSSLFYFSADKRLACWGVAVSILAMLLIALPVIAYN